MSLAWVAGSVRASLLASRRLGRAGARALADHRSLEHALRELSGSPYGHDVAAAKSLEEAQRAVAMTLLWHLRVLSGWLPPAGGELLRLMAAWFEIANVQDRLAYFAGETHRPAFELGALRTAWPALARTGSAEQMRAALAGSPWGDPGSSEPAVICAAMRAVWAGRLVATVPEAAGWARSATALLVAREASRGGTPGTAFCRVAGLRDGWPRMASPADLATLLPASLSWVLAGVDRPEDLWLAESRWWSRIEADAGRLAAARHHGRETVVGVVGLLAVDAWRVRAALAAAALGQVGREAFDAVA
jgi:hypothetical protein